MASKDEVLEAMELARMNAVFTGPSRSVGPNGMPVNYMKAALRAADALGFQLVPKEASVPMVRAGTYPLPHGAYTADAIEASWSAMLSAAPQFLEEGE